MGSLAVEQIINFPTNPDDIDIQLKKPDFENFEQLTSLMEELGYQLIDLHEHKFEKASIHVGFASVETLKNYAGWLFGHSTRKNGKMAKNIIFQMLNNPLKSIRQQNEMSGEEGKERFLYFR